MSEEKKCACSGARFCGICAPQRVASAAAAAASEIPKLELLWCCTCRRLFHCPEKYRRSALRGCADHHNFQDDSPLTVFDEASFMRTVLGYYPFQGMRVVPSLLSDEEEAQLAAFMDFGPLWVASQSGRRKIDWFAGKLNFKERKAKLKDYPGTPLAMQLVMQKVSKSVSNLGPREGECKLSRFSNCTAGLVVPASDVEAMSMSRERGCGCLLVPSSASPPPPSPTEFNIIGVAALEYTPGVALLAAHLDDANFYGARIAGLSLLADSTMTFMQRVSKNGDPENQEQLLVSVRVPLLRRALFVMSSCVRYHWLHGIDAADITNRRLSLTFREPSETLLRENPEVAAQLCASVQRFV